ncbi:MAG: hypothetical protein JWM93_3986 [Frankiales bacterium]|nr:hypothetical protein [Frankiales bacterium]
MPWAKVGDDAATHPIVMRVLERGELDVATLTPWDRANLVFGFVLRCATHSAGHLTDHFISLGTVMTMGGPQAQRWADEARRAGYWKKTKVDGQAGYQLVAIEEFIHIRLKDEVEWERQQRNDTRNPDLCMPVRARDGDGCRYCGVVVQWNNRRGARGATYDHRNPGKPALTVEDLVVACKACNSGRKNDPDADERYPLRPVPLEPYYSQGTLAQLAKYGLHPRSGSQPAHATPITSRSGSQPAHATPRDPAPARTPRNPVSAEDLADGAGSAGSGRARAGSGSGVGPGSGAAPRSQRRRGRRGRPGRRLADDP